MEQFDKSDASELRLDLRGYFYLLLSWAWLIVLAGALAGATAFVMSKRMTPIYAASARLLVNAPSTISGVDPSTGMLTMQTLTTTYVQMLMDPSVMQGVIEQLKLQTTPEALAQSISVKAIADTQLLEITAADTDPRQAADTANAVATVFAARIQGLRSQRYAAIRDGLSSQLSSMEQLISTTSDQIAAIEQEMAAAAAQKAAIVGTQLAISATQTVTAMEPQGAIAATETVMAMQRQIAAATTQTAAAAPPTVAPAGLVQLQDRLTQYRTVYSNLVLSYEQVRMAEEQTSSNVLVSQEARVNAIPVRPKTWQNTLLAGLAGTLLAAGIVLMAENLDDTIRSPDKIQRNFKLPILGVIVRHEVRAGKPVTLAEPHSAVAEAFRSLRTNIMYTAVNRRLRRILITSPTPQEGKTTIASNLSVVLSQNEKRVILVDADLRKPNVHHQFGLKNRVGLTNLFVRPLDDISSIIHVINRPKLSVLTSGGIAPNPAELLTSQLMGKILDTLDQDFDIVVIDSPPSLVVTDAVALAASVDGVILVAKPGTTKVAELKQALQQLHALGAPVLGVVLNEVNPSNLRYGYYYSQYHSKYSHYYDARQAPGKLLGGGARSKQRSTRTPLAPAAEVAEVDVVATESEAAVPEPPATVPEMETIAAKPEPAVLEPETTAAEVEAIAAEREAIVSELEARVAGPGKRHSRAAVKGDKKLTSVQTKNL